MSLKIFTIGLGFENTLFRQLVKTSCSAPFSSSLRPTLSALSMVTGQTTWRSLMRFWRASYRQYAYFVEFRHAHGLTACGLILSRNESHARTQQCQAVHRRRAVVSDRDCGFGRKTGAYVRLHGRNRKSGLSGTRGRSRRSQRYDYSYTEQELVPWKERIAKIKTGLGQSQFWVYFNNILAGTRRVMR